MFFSKGTYENYAKSSGIHKMPDGSIQFHKANKDQLFANLRINDLRTLGYHRVDGVTRIGLRTNWTDNFYYFTLIK